MSVREAESSLIRWLDGHQIPITPQQIEQFQIYYRLLVEWNEKINLTTIVSPAEVYVKHFIDSISLLVTSSLSKVATFADIGSGAGFPSIPLSIMRPDIRVTIIDSLQKRITFLNELVKELGLPQIICIHGRAEEVARFDLHRDQYDIVTARAVARLPVLIELCCPFVKPQGMFIAFKSMDYSEELNESSKSMSCLNVKVDSKSEFFLPDGSFRVHLKFRKTGNTPNKYPRKAGIPSRNPLI